TKAAPYIDNCLQFVHKLRQDLNNRCSALEPLQLICVTLAIVWLIHKLKCCLRFTTSDNYLIVFKRKAFQLMMKLPFIGSLIEKEIRKAENAVKHNMMKPFEKETFITRLPQKGNGYSTEKILDEAKKYQNLGKIGWKEGRVSGTVYADCNNEERNSLLTKVFDITSYTNPLHADIFPGIRKMEAEVVRISLTLFHGDKKSCGTVTTGGTESILLVCKAYRDYARYVKGICDPEMIVPVTAHAAFDKASQMLSMKIKHIPIDSISMKVKIKDMQSAITRNTCMLVGSAPAFPHGTVDSITEIGKLGLKFDIPVHVDCCLGGFLVPFLKDAGFPVVQCDFSVPGVTSISADTHKYGFAPKGSSVIMYSDKKYRHYQYSVQTDWPGGVYASPNVGGSRSGATIATCWAALLYQGYEGYVDATRKIIQTTAFIKSQLSGIEGLFIYGDPILSVIAFGSKRFDIFGLSDGLSAKGWNVNPLQFPSGFHICVTLMHTVDGVAQKFVEDVKNITAELLKNPSAKMGEGAAIYGTAQSIPDRSLISSMAQKYLDFYYSTDRDD
ncbi:sphingosine-1-phosphate lyase 1-like isoform X3, partial [Dinothrombium tinctorium]